MVFIPSARHYPQLSVGLSEVFSEELEHHLLHGSSVALDKKINLFINTLHTFGILCGMCGIDFFECQFSALHCANEPVL